MRPLKRLMILVLVAAAWGMTFVPSPAAAHDNGEDMPRHHPASVRCYGSNAYSDYDGESYLLVYDNFWNGYEADLGSGWLMYRYWVQDWNGSTRQWEPARAYARSGRAMAGDAKWYPTKTEWVRYSPDTFSFSMGPARLHVRPGWHRVWTEYRWYPDGRRPASTHWELTRDYENVQKGYWGDLPRSDTDRRFCDTRSQPYTFTFGS